MFFSSRFSHHLLTVVGLLSASFANAQIYTADLSSSEWKTISSPFACSLNHNIPIFGKAVFSRKAGGGELFYLETLGKVVFPVGQATLETFPPVWRSDVLPVHVGDVTAIAGKQPITLNSAQIAAVVIQLSAGVNLMYTSQSVATVSSSPAVTRVILTAKNFASAYKSYQQCIADIIPYTFAQIARTTINYSEKSTGLTVNNKTDLNKIARYIKADANVVGVFVDGHSDNSGTAEAREAASRQAAESVTTYLTERGVAVDKVTTRWHADKFLIANNKTDAGRAQNRRVTVRLEDEATHKEFMKKEEENRKADEKAAAGKALVETKKSDASVGAAINNSSSSRSGKMSPEEISRMVEGLDILK